MRTIAPITLVLAGLALACEAPAERDDSAEMAAAIPAGGPGEAAPAEGEPEEPAPQPSGEFAAMPMPGPRTSTPGGAASGLHAETG
ncbi:MAG TPA: hypothetical protein VIL20_20620 [Sandaracinaceae bacterium]